MKLKVVLFLILSLFNALSVAQTTLVGVAANFSQPMQAIAQAFEQQTGHTAKLSLGSSGKLVAQIENGAPFEVFLAADEDSVRKLEQSDMTVTGTSFIYAQGKLVLWSAQDNLVDDKGEVLKQGQFKHLALASPKLAPYGKAAVAFLQKKGWFDAVQSKLVEGENISQTYQFISTGNAELGFVALSQILENGHVSAGSYWLVPAEDYPPIKQSGVLLKLGQENPAAVALLDYLKSASAQAIIKKYGYDVVP